MSSLFEELIRNIPAVFYRCQSDENWTMLYLNGAIHEVSGYPPSDFIENRVRTFASIIHPDDTERVFDIVDKATLKKECWTFEYRIINSEGAIKWVSETGNAIYTDSGELEYLDGFIIDRSERKQLEEELARAHKMEAVGQLAAGISHEINTPIQFIGDNLNFLAGGFKELSQVIAKSVELVNRFETGDDPKFLIEQLRDEVAAMDEYLLEDIPASISESSEGIQRVSEIVKAMKEFSHPGNDSKEGVDLRRMVESTLAVARNEWKYVAEAETEFTEDLPMVECFPGELNQVILNIVVNAAHAIQSRQAAEGSSEKGIIKIKVYSENESVVIAVSDNGCGIEQQYLNKVFDPFFTTKEVGKGTGQGLSMAYSTIVDMHQGELTVESVLGDGTVMNIKLPCKSA